MSGIPASRVIAARAQLGLGQLPHQPQVFIPRAKKGQCLFAAFQLNDLSDAFCGLGRALFSADLSSRFWGAGQNRPRVQAAGWCCIFRAMFRSDIGSIVSQPRAPCQAGGAPLVL